MTDRILTSAQAINEALAIMGERDKNVILMGQGIDDKGAFYGTTSDLRLTAAFDAAEAAPLPTPDMAKGYIYA